VKLRCLCVGKITASYLREGIAEFTGRLQRYLPLEVLEVKEEKTAGKKGSIDYIRDREGERLLEKIPQSAYVVLLDEAGMRFSSQGLSDSLGHHMLHGTQELVFVLGGAYGLSETLKRRADLLLSLSPMTLTHQMARLLLLEQLYRGMTILRNEPYHNA